MMYILRMRKKMKISQSSQGSTVRENNNSCSMKEFFDACKAGDANTVLQFIKTEVNVNKKFEKRSALCTAILNNCPQIAQILLQHGAIMPCSVLDDNSKIRSPPLIWVVQQSLHELAKELMDHVDIDSCTSSDSECKSVLSIACGLKDLPMVQLLLEHGADVNGVEMEYVTPFQVCCSNNSVDIALLLLTHGVDVNVDPNGQNADCLLEIMKNPQIQELVDSRLDWKGAVLCHRLGVMEALLQTGTQIDQTVAVEEMKELTALEYAAEKGWSDMVALLMKKYHSSKKVHGTEEYMANATGAFVAAVENENVDVVDAILNNRDGTWTDDNWTKPFLCGSAIHVAVERANLELLDVLVRYGADVNVVNEHGESPVLLASRSRSKYPLFIYLMDHGADPTCVDKKFQALTCPPNEDAKAAFTRNLSLLWAAFYDKPEVVIARYESGDNLEEKLKDGRTGLILACQNNALETVKFLVGKGADVNSIDMYDWSALMQAVRLNCPEIVSYLIESGASIEHRSRDYYRDDESFVPDRCALSAAVYYEFLPIVEILIKAGANVNAVDKSERSSFHLACQEGYLEIAQYLVTNGADTDIIDTDGKKGIDYLETDKESMEKFIQDTVRNEYVLK